jgi:radical SAM superfamily enzyme YgiQ (UPF0313 family)
MLERAIQAGVGKEFTTSPNPALLTLSALTPPPHEVEYIDEIYEPLPVDRTYDIVGVSAQTRHAVRAYEIAAEFKKRGAHTVLGGVHATLCPEEGQRFFDTVFVGEAEELWPHFLNDLQNHKPQKVYQNSAGHHISLADQPCPAYHKVKTEEYPNVAVLTQRGCPAECSFCTIPPLYGRKLRQKNIDSVIDEVKTILGLWKKKPTIYFGDENFFIDRPYARALIEKLKPLHIKWNTKSTVDICEQDDLLELAYESGLRKIQIGLESIQPESLKSIDQGRKLKLFEKYEHYSKAIEAIQKHCIAVVANFVFGFDNEDLSIFEMTKQFILQNTVAATRLAFLVPFPGTMLYKKLKAENRLYHEDWERYTNFEVLFKHPRMQKEEMEAAFVHLVQAVNAPERLGKIAAYFKDRLMERRGM